LKNQLQSTKRSLTAAREERSTLEQTLADQASQLSSIQTQLSSAKAAYETETNLLVTFKERHSTQVADIQNTRKELIGAESDLSAIRVEKAEIEGAFLRDKEEARELHKRMIETGKQAEALKADVERLKKEAKQQKGLLAIARKQLSTKESEKGKAEREHAEAVEELSSITRDKDTVDAELAIMTSPEPKVARRTLSSDSLSFAASQPIPMTPDLSLPPVKSNNPFERLAMSSPLSQRSSSPFSIQGSAPPSLSSTEPTSLPPSTTNEVSLELPEPDLLAASSTFNSFSAVQTPASPKFSQLSGDLHLQSVLSPATVNDTDYFVTPPTSVEHGSDASLTHPKERFPSLDKLPDSIPTNAMDSLPPKHLSTADVDTNLVAHLKELDIEKSDDSDSDSNDEKPLAVLAANISKRPTKSTPLSQGIDTNSSAPASAPTSAFDDIFGPDNADEVQTHLPTTGNPIPSNVSIVPSEHTEDTIHTSTQASNVAGVNEFDETMGKMPASATPANFSFGPGFDDNFDFASASASKTLEEPKIEIQDRKKTTQKVEFDDIFKDEDVPKTTGPSTPFYLPPTDKDRTSGTFDAIFAGFESSPVLKLEDKPNVDSPTALSRSDEPSIPGSFPQLPSLTTPPAQTIITSPRPSDIKPTPLRERSPPPLRSPQQPRSSSSSSSKDNHDKPKEPQARHSKLSVRPI
jgi:epidermal growth factor receptor substrate 15